jgi:hypothetical protein
VITTKASNTAIQSSVRQRLGTLAVTLPTGTE